MIELRATPPQLPNRELGDGLLELVGDDHVDGAHVARLDTEAHQWRRHVEQVTRDGDGAAGLRAERQRRAGVFERRVGRRRRRRRADLEVEVVVHQLLPLAVRARRRCERAQQPTR